ncbi:DUF4198 domain-containing protein [Streptomyces yaizuensis]|uniref:DUF4198 domain-containing protein n=1 Tax=Streptomyces yaizuensis TaxID=2989713 RepID=A0ABQ5NY58_9ACTN|nr:DUF4198 domain-containing protein [Streptomyces sp. YSPA8]
MTVWGTAVALAASGGVTALGASAQPIGTVRADQRSVAPEGNVFVSSGDDYRAFVLDNGTKLTRVEIRPRGGKDAVATLTTFTRREDDEAVWWESPVFALDAIGSYEMDIYAEDPRTGREVSRPNADTFLYSPGADIEVSSDQDEFSLDDLEAVATGRATARDPRTGERVPLAGTTVSVYTQDWGNGGIIQVRTDADGRFSTPYTVLGTEQELWLNARIDDDLGRELGRQGLRIRPQKSSVELSGPTRNLTARYGGTPISGRITRIADDGTVRPAVRQYTMAQCLKSCGNTGSTFGPVTSADGSFTISPRVTMPGSWRIQSRSPWLTHTSGGELNYAKVTHTTRMTEEKVVSTTKNKLTFSARPLLRDGTSSQPATVLVRARRHNGEWATISQKNVPFGRTATFTADAPLFRVTGWRLSVLEKSGIGPSDGKVLNPGRLQTWFNMKSHPRLLDKGDPLTLKGTLYTATAKNTAQGFAGQRVHYSFRAPGTAWKSMGTVTTDKNGAFTKTFKAERAGDWKVDFTDGGSKRFDNTIWPRWIHVR